MSDSTPHPSRYQQPDDDPEDVDRMAHLMVALLPQGLPPETRGPMIRRWLDSVERILRGGGAAYVPAWLPRARELYLGEAAEGEPHRPESPPAARDPG